MGIQTYAPTIWRNDRAPGFTAPALTKREYGIVRVTDEAIQLKDNPNKAQETVPGVFQVWESNGTGYLETT